MTSPISAAGADVDAAGPAPLTLGVEEEFLLLDPRTGENVPLAEEVTAELADTVRQHSRLEVRRSIVEMATPVCVELSQLRRELIDLRRAAAEAADDVGARLVAVGATPVAERYPAVPAQPRYQAIARRYGPVALDPAVCGVHVHVGLPDRDLAVQVCNQLQAWLPVVRALCGNSPIYRGADTGHASWRSVQLLRWPGLGPTPYFDSADEYDRTVTDLVTCGVILDARMVYWYARLSPRYPTVEIRVGDVCPTVDDTVLVAALIRAAVATAVAASRAGTPAPRLHSCVVAAAHWRAAHDGLSDALIDLRLGRARPAWDLVDEFVAAVSPALLRSGDLDLVVDELTRLRGRGDGASRQRRVHERTADIRAVLSYLSEQTVAG